MAKKSILERNKKRAELFAKYKDKRNALKALIKKSRFSEEDRALTFQRVLELDKLPRGASISKQRNRCLITGRARGLVCYKYFGLCGIQLRHQANAGRIPGIRKT